MLVEFDNNLINLKNVAYVYKEYSENRLEIHFISQRNTLFTDYENAKELDNGFSEFIRLIKLSSNFNIDNDGHFMCNHCGAPN
jgi:hypothetical protein